MFQTNSERYLSDILLPDIVNYNHLYIFPDNSKNSSLFAPTKSEKVLQIRIDVIQKFPCLKDDNSSLAHDSRDLPGLLVLTELRIIFIPYRSRSEKLLRLRFAKLDVNNSGSISPLELYNASKDYMNNKIHVDRKDTNLKDLKMNNNVSVEVETDEIMESMIKAAFHLVDKDMDGSINLEEFMKFMGLENQNYSAVQIATIQASLGSINTIDFSEIYDRNDSSISDLVTSSKNLNLIEVCIPNFEDVTGSWDKFDYNKFYKFDYKFEDFKYQYRVYIVKIMFGSEVQWEVRRRYSDFEILLSSLATRLPNLQLPELPPKTPTIGEWPLFSSDGYINFLESRQGELEKFLKKLIRFQEVWDQRCWLVQRFLDNTDSLEHFERANQYFLKKNQESSLHKTFDQSDVSNSQINVNHEEEGYPSPTADTLESSHSNLMSSFLEVRDLISSSSSTISLGNNDTRSKFASKELKNKEYDRHQSLTISTNNGKRFYFEICHSSDASFLEARYGCDGELTNFAWCSKLKENIRKLVENDKFSYVLASSPIISDYRLKHPIKGDFSLLAEYCRIGVPNKTWAISDINANYDTIPSYPKILIIPSLFLDQSMDSLLNVVAQRSRGRIPVLTWLHPISEAPLFRSSQPLSGLINVLEDDDFFLRAIQMTTHEKGDKILRIVDARPKLNAMANSYMGKGFEDITRLGPNFQIHFMGIENVHVMRQSLDKLSEAIYHGGDHANSTTSYDSLLVASNWLFHCRQILQGALFVTNCLEAGDPVLVHCSDGWDRTSQLCAIAQLLLDPYYRTFEGFKNLVEKDFCAFGHLFDTRIGSVLTDEKSPIFLQFLDVVWHIIRQFPTAFEFSEIYLEFLADAVYSRCFSTFSGDSERERVALRNSRFNSPVTIPQRQNLSPQETHGGSVNVNSSSFNEDLLLKDEGASVYQSNLFTPVRNTEKAHVPLSIWEYFDIFFPRDKSVIKNPLYSGFDSSGKNISTGGLKPSIDPRIWSLWDSYFLRGSSVNLNNFKVINTQGPWRFCRSEVLYQEQLQPQCT